MAEFPKTMRPETRTEGTGYRPISSLAVAAVIVSGLGAVVVTTLAVGARLSSKPVLYPSVLLLPFTGLGLALAARWQLRRSEGTRVGTGLASVGLWLGFLFGTAYAAYYLATEFAIRQQAAAAAMQFFDFLNKGESEKAFRLTLPPAQQLSIAEDDRDGIRKRFGANDFFVFERSDLSRVYRSWPGKIVMEQRGVQGWEVLPNGFQVEMDYRMRNPEGLFGVSISLTGHDEPTTGARQWQVVFGRTGFGRDRQTTKLGRLFLEMQFEATKFLPGWSTKLYGGDIDTSGMVRLDGKIPESGKKELLEAQLKAPASINVFPGSALRPAGLPTVFTRADGVDLVHVVELHLPALGEVIAGTLTLRATGPELLAEVQRLQGADWLQQPLLEGTDDVPEISRFKYEFKVVEVNATPNIPRAGGPRGAMDVISDSR